MAWPGPRSSCCKCELHWFIVWIWFSFSWLSLRDTIQCWLDLLSRLILDLRISSFRRDERLFFNVFGVLGDVFCFKKSVSFHACWNYKQLFWNIWSSSLLRYFSVDCSAWSLKKHDTKNVLDLIVVNTSSAEDIVAAELHMGWIMSTKVDGIRCHTETLFGIANGRKQSLREPVHHVSRSTPVFYALRPRNIVFSYLSIDHLHEP